MALVSIASTFRPTTDALPREGGGPGPPGIERAARHAHRRGTRGGDAGIGQGGLPDGGPPLQGCSETLELFDVKYRRGDAFAYDYAMDPEDLAEILKSVRSARENADFVIVSIHSHECTAGCDDGDEPRGAGNF